MYERQAYMHTAQLKSTKQRDPSTVLTIVQDLSLKAPSPSLIFCANSWKVRTSPATSTSHRNISAACSNNLHYHPGRSHAQGDCVWDSVLEVENESLPYFSMADLTRVGMSSCLCQRSTQCMRKSAVEVGCCI